MSVKNFRKIIIIALMLCILVCMPGVMYHASLSEPAFSIPYTSGLNQVKIEAEFLPDGRKLSAVQTIRFVNRFDVSFTELIFRTYANAFKSEETSPAAIEEIYDSCYVNGFSSGGIEIKSISAGGAPAGFYYRDRADTVLAVPLLSPLEPGETIQVIFNYIITLPECHYRFGYAGRESFFGNAFPIPAVFENGSFREDEYYPIGDPFISECADYLVSVTVPKGYTAIGTGSSEQKGLTFVFTAKAVRDFMLIISDKYTVKTGKAEGISVSSYARTAQEASKALNYALKAIKVFSSVIDPLVYQSVTIAQIDFAFSGMEYPQLIVVGRSIYKGNDSFLEWTVAHEMAHQWFYAAVGTDQINEPWQDEALCEYMVYEYLGKQYGEKARLNAVDRTANTAMRITIPRGVTPGSPIHYFSDFSEYFLVVYNRGAAFFIALEEWLGRESLRDVLREYYRRFTFSIASRSDFESVLNSYSGLDLSSLVIDYLDTCIEITGR